MLEALRYRIQRTGRSYKRNRKRGDPRYERAKTGGAALLRYKVATLKIIKRSPSDTAAEKRADQEI